MFELIISNVELHHNVIIKSFVGSQNKNSTRESHAQVLQVMKME